MSAKLATITNMGSGGAKLEVTFNPASLKVATANKLQGEDAKADKKDKSGTKPTQATGPSTNKLDTELVFDTTETGTDVRFGPKGSMVLKDMATAPEGDHPAMPLVEFRWGNFVFSGVIESFTETLDFWSSEGIPLRSTVQISMQEVGKVKQGDKHASLSKAKRQAVVPVPPGGRGTSDVGAANGNPGAGRALAAANGIEDMRMAAGGAVAVAASVDFQAAASFSMSASAGASASAGLGASASASAGAGASLGFGIGASASAGASVGFGASAGASAGFGASAGIGASAGASFGAGASAGFGAEASAGFGAGASSGFSAGASASAFGGTATAGVSASAGAFAGLGSSKTTGVSLPFDPSSLLPAPSPMVGQNPQFDVTGKLTSSSSSLGASVTGRASAGVTFV